MLAIASPVTATEWADTTDPDGTLTEVILLLFGSMTLHCKIGWSLIISSFFGKTQNATGSGLSVGPTIPLAGITLNMLHTHCGQPGVGNITNLKQCQNVC